MNTTDYTAFYYYEPKDIVIGLEVESFDTDHDFDDKPFISDIEWKFDGDFSETEKIKIMSFIDNDEDFNDKQREHLEEYLNDQEEDNKTERMIDAYESRMI